MSPAEIAGNMIAAVGLVAIWLALVVAFTISRKPRR